MGYGVFVDLMGKFRGCRSRIRPYSFPNLSPPIRVQTVIVVVGGARKGRTELVFSLPRATSG